MEVRFASEKDLDLIKDFFLRQEDKLGTFNFYQHCFENGFSNHEFKLAICVVDKIIISSKHMFLRNFSPSWISGGIHVYPKNNYFNCKTNGIELLMTHCVEYAESLGYFCYEWHQTVGKKYHNRFKRMRDQIDILKRYEHYDIGIIPASKESTFKIYSSKSPMIRKIKEFDILIKSAELKNEFRKIPSLAIDRLGSSTK
jgi:hypothetical protein